MSEDIYKETILDHFRHPRNFGELPNANARAREANVVCGDVIEMQLRVDGDKVEDVRFQGQGCAISLASASKLTEFSKGKSVSEIKQLGKRDMIRVLGSDPGVARVECLLLGLKVLKIAIRNHLGDKASSEIEED